jgi:hypothetical protein
LKRSTNCDWRKEEKGKHRKTVRIEIQAYPKRRIK